MQGPFPAAAAAHSRFHGASGGPVAVRTVPNLPGALIRRLAQRLGVSPTVAMRVALLYGDIEWRAGGATRFCYSARDYARRTGLHPHTVQADLRHLIAIGAIDADYNPIHAATLALQGLLTQLPGDGNPAEEAIEAAASPGRFPDPAGRGNHPAIDTVSPDPGRPFHPAPGRFLDPGLVDQTTQPWSNPSTTLEKGLKTQEKEDRKKKRSKPTRSSKAQEPAEELPGNLQSPGAAASRALGSGAPEPDGTAGTGLLDRLLAAFRQAAPSEWPAPERLTASRERRSRLRQALEHAGSTEALERRLRAALAHVPPWFRTTYPVRPDGSRRPAYQFFDLLLRASAAERDCGVEAWHLFAWSEGALAPSMAAGSHASGAAESDLQRARRLLEWDSCQWCSIGIEGAGLPRQEKRRLASLLEERGFGIAGTAERQYGPPSAAVGLAPTPASIKPQTPVPPDGLHPVEPSDVPAEPTP